MPFFVRKRKSYDGHESKLSYIACFGVLELAAKYEKKGNYLIDQNVSYPANLLTSKPD